MSHLNSTASFPSVSRSWVLLTVWGYSKTDWYEKAERLNRDTESSRIRNCCLKLWYCRSRSRNNHIQPSPGMLSSWAFVFFYERQNTTIRPSTKNVQPHPTRRPVVSPDRIQKPPICHFRGRQLPSESSCSGLGLITMRLA